MEMQKKGLSNAQNRADSSHGARPARRVYHILPDAVYCICTYFYLHSCPISPNFGRASAYIHTVGVEC
jgi:hypothetical protein